MREIHDMIALLVLLLVLGFLAWSGAKVLWGWAAAVVLILFSSLVLVASVALYFLPPSVDNRPPIRTGVHFVHVWDPANFSLELDIEIEATDQP